MSLLLFIGFIVLCILFPVFRCAVTHPVKTVVNAVVDLYYYIKYHKWNECATGEIVAYCGLFGKGKTLSAVHKVCMMYRRYNGKKVFDRSRNSWVTQRLVVISNVSLSIPYTDFVSMQQVVDAAERREKYDAENNTRTITVILGDEFSVQLNSREFKSNFNPLLLNTILTCRHHYISLYYTSQRFAHVDALLRQVTSYVVDCDKIWRFQKNYEYDAWDMENASNVQLLRPRYRGCWFVTNKDYAAYNTLACVGNLTKQWKAGDMLTEEEILNLQQTGTGSVDNVVNISSKFKRFRKKITKK